MSKIAATPTLTVDQELEVVLVEVVFHLADWCTAHTDQYRVHKAHSGQRLLLTAVVTHYVSTPSTVMLHAHTHTYATKQATRHEDTQNDHVKSADRRLPFCVRK